MSDVIHDASTDHGPDAAADGDQLARQEAISQSAMAVSPRPDAAAKPLRPPVVIPTNKVTVALPFSKITIEEPGRELAELAAIVAELATFVAATTTEPEAARLQLRAQVLAARVR